MTPRLRADGVIVKQAVDDADTMIVSAALDFARSGQSVTLFANDTDVIVMLLHLWKNEMANIWIRSEFTRNGRKHLKQLSIKDAVSDLGDVVVHNLLFLHAFGGCDTTSAVHDKGKAGILQLVQKSKQAQHLCKVFASPNSSQYQVGNADIQMFLLLYGGKIDDRLHQLRYTSYIKMFASSSKISPSKLPPTERAAWYHSLRVYLQVHSIY